MLGYALQAVARQAPDVDWLRYASPYAWVFHDAPLANGAEPSMLALTWGLAVLGAAAAAVALRSRDLRG